MRYIKLYIIIIFITVAVLVCGCTDMSQYISLEEYNSKLSELEEAKNISSDKDVEILELKEEANTLKNSLDLSYEEIEKYESLINNLNSLLGNVYYGYASSENYILDGFTAFSIFYNEKYYLLTAGHCVENYDIGRMTNFKFKANFTNEWIWPKLLAYDNDYIGNNDYAILCSDKINSGLSIDYDNDYPKYILGSNKSGINIIKSFYDKTFEGESGSAVVDYEGEIIGMNTTDMHNYFTKIDTILEAINNLE